MTEMEITWRVSSGRVGEERGGKVTENKKHKWWVEDRQRDIKNNRGNGEAKELIYMSHRHELRQGMLEGWEVQGGGGIKGEENWENCNSIINKIDFKKEA